MTEHGIGREESEVGVVWQWRTAEKGATRKPGWQSGFFQCRSIDYSFSFVCLKIYFLYHSNCGLAGYNSLRWEFHSFSTLKTAFSIVAFNVATEKSDNIIHMYILHILVFFLVHLRFTFFILYVLSFITMLLGRDLFLFILLLPRVNFFNLRT